jgi:[acyl-carrier-protein] S-malonyltransferase
MGRIAALFPGQGSQRAGMGADYLASYPALRDLYFARADETLGTNLTEICLTGSAEELQRTENTQPALFVVSMAILHVVRQGGLEPAAAAGHSVGEYAALTCAGVLRFDDALRLLRRRGELMAALNRRSPGAMAAIIGLPPGDVEALCRAAQAAGPGVVEPANYNEPLQTVISGHAAAVDRAMALAADAGAERVVRLQVGAPFHSSLMAELGDAFGDELDACAFSDPRIPVVANATGDYVRTANEAKDALKRQVAGAVHWTATIRRLLADGHDTFVEVGPGRVLTGFCKRIAPEAAVHSTGDVRRAARVLAAGSAHGADTPAGSESAAPANGGRGARQRRVAGEASA